MKFIEIKEGLSIRKDGILGVEVNPNGGTTIITSYGSYESNFPYSSILMLLESGNIEESVVNASRGAQPWEFSGQHWRG